MLSGEGTKYFVRGSASTVSGRKNLPVKKEEEKRGFITNKTVLSHQFVDIQSVAATVTGAVQTFLK